MSTLGLKNGANAEGYWTMVVRSENPPTKGVLCLCDLKPMKQLVHSNHLKRPAAGCCLIASSPISCPGVKLRQRDRHRVFIVHVTLLWLSGSNMQSWAPFRATWDLLLMTCFWCQRRSSSIWWSDELQTTSKRWRSHLLSHWEFILSRIQNE